MLLTVLKRRGIPTVEIGRMMDWIVMYWKKMLSVSCSLILEVNVIVLKRRKILIVDFGNKIYWIF